VQAAAVAVHEPPFGGGDQITEGRNAVLQRHANQASRHAAGRGPRRGPAWPPRSAQPTSRS
jgi:hypothetical protein